MPAAAPSPTITLGRHHRPGYDRQRPDLFATQLLAAERAVDPDGLLNPGILIDL
jgi:alkyldihydroxyacetonephosphate synthase